MELFKHNIEFKIGATRIEDIPPTYLPEICFAGRSNVGKSSLINALTYRKDIARVSKRPGCTRQLNFFMIAEKFYLVDMPGYGFAEASKSEKLKWQNLIRDYLRGRVKLKRVFVLIDSRHGVKSNDIEIMKMLDETAVSYQIVLTKTDEVKKQELEQTIASLEDLSKKHPALHPEFIHTSSHTGAGLDKFRRDIEKLL
jgi:GTP-binding protein